MPKSMTGFGRAKLEKNKRYISMEIKSVNSRYFDLNIRSPRIFSAFESDWRKLIQKEVFRGKIDLRVTYRDESDEAQSIRADHSKVKAYAQAYKEIYELLGEEVPDLAQAISERSDVFVVEDDLVDEEGIKDFTLEVLSLCLEDFGQMRANEGHHLKIDMVQRIKVMEDLCQKVAEKAHTIPSLYRQRLLDRIENVLDLPKEEFYDGQRIAAEVAIYADRADVEEELVRLKGHLEQFTQILNSKGPVGKKLDFLIQEMNREANTLASKAQDIEMVQAAVELKSQVEQLREQIQNIE